VKAWINPALGVLGNELVIFNRMAGEGSWQVWSRSHGSVELHSEAMRGIGDGTLGASQTCDRERQNQ